MLFFIHNFKFSEILFTMAKLVTLDLVREGAVAVIDKLNVSELKIYKRLLELGFVKGTKLEVIKKTKQVLLVGIRGYTLAIDKKITEQIDCFEV